MTTTPSAAELRANHFFVDGYDTVKGGYAVRRTYDPPKAKHDIAWFITRDEAQQYCDMILRDRDLAALRDQQADEQRGKGEAWRCFHCDEVFTSVDAAREHFGSRLEHSAACCINTAEYRKMEQRMEAYNAEDAEIHRELYRLRSAHRVALREEEEKGYARGLHDAREDTAPIEPQAAAVRVTDAVFDLAWRTFQEYLPPRYTHHPKQKLRAALEAVAPLLAQQAAPQGVGPCTRCGAVCEDDAAFDVHQCKPRAAPQGDEAQAVSWRDSGTAPNCPTIKYDEPVKLVWRDAQGRRCTRWMSAQDVGDELAARPSPPAQAPGLQALVSKWRHEAAGANISVALVANAFANELEAALAKQPATGDSSSAPAELRALIARMRAAIPDRLGHAYDDRELGEWLDELEAILAKQGVK